MPTLVTGATGFIGGRLVEALAQRGEAIRALVRQTSKVDRLRSLGVELAYGDVTDAESVTAAMEGCDHVYHLANIYDWWLPDRSQFYQVNVEGTRNVLSAALEAGVEKAVYTSTEETIGERPGEVQREDTVHRGYFYSDYERSKYLGEKTAFDVAAQGLPLVCVNPAGVIGPGDIKQTDRMIIAYLKGQLIATLNPPINVVYIGDVVQGHLRAMDMGRPGERYLLAGENTDMVTAFGLVREIAGYGRTLPVIPLWTSGLVALGYEALSKITRRPPLISRDFARKTRHGWLIDNTKASQELGMTFTPLREALEKAIAWYKENGYVKP